MILNILIVVVPTICYIGWRSYNTYNKNNKTKIKSKKFEGYNYKIEKNPNNNDYYDFHFSCSFIDFYTKYETFALKELSENLIYISNKRPEYFNSMLYTVQNMFNHLKYLAEEDYDNTELFSKECRKHNEELLQPIVNKIKEEECIAEEKLKEEKQRIINKEKEEYDFQYNACKELLLDKLELGKVEFKKTNIAKVNLKKNIDDYLEKVDENVINRNNQEYNNICKGIERDYYMHTGKKLQRSIGLGCEIRGGYGNKILSYSEDDNIIKLKTKILEEDRHLKYLVRRVDRHY